MNNAINILLWAGQITLALAFSYSGINKAMLSRDALMAKGQTGIAGYSMPAIRAIAVVELAGVLGLLLPWALDIAPLLTPASAAGFAVIMVLAARIHARRGEGQSVGLNLFLLCVAVVVTVARFRQLG